MRQWDIAIIRERMRHTFWSKPYRRNLRKIIKDNNDNNNNNNNDNYNYDNNNNNIYLFHRIKIHILYYNNRSEKSQMSQR